MNILVVGDLHFKEKGIRRYQKMSEEIISVIKQHQDQIDAVVLLGDTLHKHEQSHQVPFDMANNFIIDISNLKHVYLIIGNHDMINNSIFLTDKHFFNPLKRLPNITVVDYPTEALIKGNKIALIPYVYPGRFFEALEKLPISFKDYRVIFGHQEIYNAKMGAIRSDTGDKWLSEYPLLISGHIHEHDILQPNMIYTGTPIQHTFGDNPNKGIFLFSFPECEDGYTMKKITLNVPIKKIFKMNAEEVTHFDAPEGLDAKIIIKDTIEAFNALIKKGFIEDLESKNITVVHENTDNVDKSEFCYIPKEERKNFRRILYDEIKDDPSLKEAFIRTFGIIDDDHREPISDHQEPLEKKDQRKKKIIKIKQ